MHSNHRNSLDNIRTKNSEICHILTKILPFLSRNLAKSLKMGQRYHLMNVKYYYQYKPGNSFKTFAFKISILVIYHKSPLFRTELHPKSVKLRPCKVSRCTKWP